MPRSPTPSELAALESCAVQDSDQRGLDYRGSIDALIHSGALAELTADARKHASEELAFFAGLSSPANDFERAQMQLNALSATQDSAESAEAREMARALSVYYVALDSTTPCPMSDEFLFYLGKTRQ